MNASIFFMRSRLLRGVVAVICVAAGAGVGAPIAEPGRPVEYSGCGMNASGYPYIPCELMSRPASSSSAGTRSPIVPLMMAKVTIEIANTTTKVKATASPWTPSWPSAELKTASPKMPYQMPGPAPSKISRGEAKMPTASVPQIPARP